MNATGTENDQLSFVEVAGAIGTVLGILAAVAALCAVILHRNAAACARVLNCLCCRRRSNRIATSAHIRRAATAAADLAGVSSMFLRTCHEPPTPPPRDSAAPVYAEPAYLEAADIHGRSITPCEQAVVAIEPAQLVPQDQPNAELPVFQLLTVEQRIALESMEPPLSGRAGRSKKITQSDSFKL
jgi:hypothetical protein